MKRQRPELPNEDSKRTTFHYNTRSSRRRGICTSDKVDESASLRVTKGRKKKKKVSDERSTKSYLYLPIDLIVEILKRLPVKTLAKFLCVSKVWGSIIRGKNFKKLFLDESSNRPGRIFFTLMRNKDNDRYLFFLNPGVSTYATAHPVCGTTVNRSSCVHDLICYESSCRSQLVVYNSTTKRSITLPIPELPGSYNFKYFLCYDPINAVYKVLCATTRPRIVYQILTLGNGNEWRMVENIYACHCFKSHICIDGVLYYDAFAGRGSTEVVVMSFDVRSEKFNLIIKAPAAADFPPRSRLTIMASYEGKLAIISRDISANGSLVLWVLEDATKHQWLRKIFVLPNSWTSLALDIPLPSPPHKLHYFLRITVAGEFILAPKFTLVPPFYLLYYNPKRNSVRKVSIQGIIEGIVEHELLQWKSDKPFLYNIFSSQVESLMFW